MLHIIFIILKIVGILLLVILGLILLAILSVLFVPIRYRLHGEWKEDQLGWARVTWLFGLIRFRVEYIERNSRVRLRIFGIDAIKIMGNRREKKSTETAKKQDGLSEVPAPESIEKTEPENDNTAISAIEQRDQNKPFTEVPGDSNKEEKKKEFFPEKVYRRLTRILDRIRNIRESIIKRIRNIRRSLENIVSNVGRIQSFLKDDKTVEAIRLLLERSGYLFRQILPRKVTGYVKYGFEDPADTGQILGVISLIVPLYGTRLSVQPVFDEKVFEADATMSGRIYGFMLLITAWKIYRNQAVKITIKRLRSREV